MASRSVAPTPRHAHLLDRLVDLVLAEGFAGFTLDELAGRLRCSKSTLYALAPSKEQLARTAVVHFFRSATEAVEAAVAAAPGRADARVVAYLEGSAAALLPASRAFLRDVAAAPLTAEVYERNARAAAARIRALIDEGVSGGTFRKVDARFVAEVVALAIGGIQRGEIGARTGLADAQAFAELAALVVAALRP